MLSPKGLVKILKKPKKRWYTLVLLIALGVFIYGFLDLDESVGFNAKNFSGWLSQLGPLSILMYLLLMILAVATPVPDSIVTVAGGYLFGLVLGGLFSLTGALLGTTINFLLARKLGRKYLYKKYPEQIKIIDEYSKKLGWQTVVMMRLLPSVSFDILGYAAGISTMRLRTYLLANIVGMLPTTYLLISVGYSVKSHAYFTAVIAFIISLVIIIGGTATIRKMYPKETKFPNTK